MKKFLLICLGTVILGFSFISCSNDNNVTSSSNDALSLNDKLIGKWNGIQILSLDANGNVVFTDILDNSLCPSFVFEFKKDGSFQMINYDNDTKECDKSVENGSWSISGNTLKSRIIGEREGSSQIKNLTEDTLEVQCSLSENEKYAKDLDLGVVAFKLVLKKQK